MKIETKATDRKALVKTIAEFTGEDAHYVGPPSFAYTIGGYTVDRNGIIASEDEEGSNALKDYLIEKGFVEPTVEELRITVPCDTNDVSLLRNLVFTLHARQYLLNRVTGRDTFAVSDSLVETMDTVPPASGAEFCTLVTADTAELRGFCIGDDCVTFIFPLCDDALKNRAYAEVSAMMVARAKEAHRISPTEQKPENEKYYLRIWLLQLGLSGLGGKESRKALLAGLKGNTAFRTTEEADKFKAEQKAKRATQKAESALASEDSDS